MVLRSSFWNAIKPNSGNKRRNARSGRQHNRVRSASLGFEPLEPRIVLSTNNPVVSVVGPQVFGQNMLLHIRDMATFTDVLAEGDTPSSDTNYQYTLLITPNPNGGDPAPSTPFAATIDNGASNPGEIVGGSINGAISFANTGVYNVLVTIEDPDGGVGSNSFPVTIEPSVSGVDFALPPEVDNVSHATGYEGSDYVLTLSNNNPNIAINQWTIYWGDGETSSVAGTESTAKHVYADDNETPDDNVYYINAKVSTEDGDFWARQPVHDQDPFVRILNVPPVLSIDANNVTDVNEGDQYSINFSLVDPGDDHVVSWAVVWEGTEGNPFGGAEQFIGALPASASHVYANGDANFNVFAIAVEDDGSVAFSNTLDVAVHKLASISGVVFVDVNHSGLFDANEPGIDGVAVKLLDQDGNQLQSVLTGDDGLYVFNGLQPGIYQVSEQQPTGVTDGAEHLGSLGGTIVTNDRMKLTLGNTDATDYAFAEIGQQLRSGDSAGIGFWQNKSGQTLIAQGGPQLAVWLTSHFGNIFGNSLVGMTGAQVATFYRDQIFKGLTVGGPVKVDAQFMAVALATYFTDLTLAGQVAAAFGFNVSDTGIGTKIVNVGTKGAAFGVSNGSDRTIMQLLLATNSSTDQFNSVIGFDAIYDKDGNGVISSAEVSLRTMANDVFIAINAAGGI